MQTNNGTSANDILSLDNPAFCTYVICCCLLILKMMGLVLLTIFHRQTNKVGISEEDARFGMEVALHPNVERTRRAFLNDLENIPAFLFLSFAYLWTRPISTLVHVVYYAFLVARALHSFVYAVYVVPQPARAICFAIGFIINGYLAAHTAIYVFIVGYLKK
ncbi:microsomal glutathione S-transferase 1-like isoform X2 [Cylas formicarius]|uniref:microsomal glutathione S-transferase 1-like isoform X2 n=1 Tax=Cylas formicarius TaxID=197179 RepID=UPI00295889A2|nr:microsomal glutathione S-transferase 1-like isoform X2 [Cylas formicarius]